MDNGRLEKRDIRERTFKFGVRIVKMANSLPKTPVGFAIGSQVVRSGTSTGANVEEAQDASSRKEFVYSMTVALKEARETHYWLKIIAESGLIVREKLENLINENIEIIKILTVIVKKAKKS